MGNIELLTKEEQNYFIEIGKQEFANGIPCIPYRSPQLSKLWEKGCAIGSEESKKRTEAGAYWMKGWTMANLAPETKKENIKFTGFEDIYENCNDGTDYWVICSNMPQKYIDEAKAIDGDNYIESCFGIVITYGYDGIPDEEAERKWFIDSDAPFYVDNNGNWVYLDYSLSEEEKSEVIKMCKEEMNRVQEVERLKEELIDIINERENEALTESRSNWLDERYCEVQKRISELQGNEPILAANTKTKKVKGR